ncbi:MAG: prenyltransferase/squalene oxidase repeat-containing protein [Pirellulaceae bacterium]
MQVLMGNVDASSLDHSQFVWGLLWGGMAAITLMLLILMQTRWGQAKPVSKCVVLSIFAHLLLMSYAHMTQMFSPPSPGYSRETVRLKLSQVDLNLPESDDVVESPKVHQPWDDFQAELPQQSTELMRMARPEAIPAMADESTMFLAESSASAVASTPIPDDMVKHPEEEIANDSPLQLTQSVEPLPAVTMETPPLEEVSQSPPAPPSPPLPSPARAAPQVAEVETPAPMSTNNDRPTAKNLQTLQDIAQSEEIADAMANEDHLAESDNLRETSSHQRTSGDRREMQSTNSPAQFASTQGGSATRRGDSEIRQRLGELALPLPQANRTLADGRPLPLVMQARVAENQAAFIEAQGGSPEVEPAINSALAWLAAVQETDGRWDARRHGAGKEARIAGHDRQSAGVNSDMGITGLATLAFLAKGHTHLEGKHRENVQQALEYLVNHQAASGSLAGEAGAFAKMYCHAMALLAISEAYAMTGDERIRPFLDRALAYTITAQHPTLGGWRYHPGDQGDMSQFGWQVMALHSATLAEIEIPDSTGRLMERFLRDSSSGTHRGLASYRPGERISPTMTAEGLLCRAFLQTEDRKEQLSEATTYLLKNLPDQGEADLYYFYYGTLAMYQMQGDAWKKWQGPLHERILSRQRTAGDMAGSWDPDTRWGNYGGRVYSTALATLSLEVYFRYLPIYGPTDLSSGINVADRPQYAPPFGR